MVSLISKPITGAMYYVKNLEASSKWYCEYRLIQQERRLRQMTTPIKNHVRGVFIPVSNIENAREWYCKILGLPTDGEVFFGHIYVLPMQGETNIVLDSKIYSPDHVFNIPVVQFATDDIEESLEFMKSINVELVTGIENGHWFNIKDPDGNVIMICK